MQCMICHGGKPWVVHLFGPQVFGGYTMVTICSIASQTSKKIGINISFHTYEYFKYLLDNFSYMGGEMFMMLHWEA
jgi:hypothetical protein